jgi:uncharacterized protein (DUF1800 family)
MARDPRAEAALGLHRFGPGPRPRSNLRSVGPHSTAGINQHAGLDENLGRETLELHTLGMRIVYTQDDVTGFAKVITGWTLTPLRS